MTSFAYLINVFYDDKSVAKLIDHQHKKDPFFKLIFNLAFLIITQKTN